MKTIVIIALFLVTIPSYSQQLPPLKTVTMATPSQRAVVMQQVGLTEISVTYNRPGVKGRKIYGEIVPYNDGKPYPWRAGAEENTTISFQHDVTIENKPLSSGKYGLHIIPKEGSWIFIFSKNSTSWGSFTYNKDEDALRVEVKSTEIPHQEWLEYEFTPLSDSSSKLSLRWEKLEGSILIEVDTKAITLQNIRNELRSYTGFSWPGYFSAAYWCAQNNYNLEEALTWIDIVLRGNLGYNVVKTKADILTKLGRAEEAKKVFDIINELGSYNELMGYVNNLILQNDSKANEVIEISVKRFPTNKSKIWYAVGNAYRRRKDKENALLSYNKALKYSNDEALKSQIVKAISDLKS